LFYIVERLSNGGVFHKKDIDEKISLNANGCLRRNSLVLVDVWVEFQVHESTILHA
jgi:hypothetical protein